MAKIVRKHSSDSFIVNITPEDNSGGAPGVVVTRRRKLRARGEAAYAKEVLRYVLPDPPTQRALDSLAKKIGNSILKDSSNTTKWTTKNKRRQVSSARAVTRSSSK